MSQDQIKRGGRVSKILKNYQTRGGEGQNKREMGTKYKREETIIGLSLNTLLTSLNIGISSVLRSRLE